MRTFPTRKSWGSRDRMALLANTSPPSTPSAFTSTDPNTETMFPSLAKSDFPDSPAKVTPRTSYDQAQISAASSAIQFVPAYQEAVSPSNTHPLTSPEDSFDREEKQKHANRAQVTPSPSNNQSSASSDKRRGPRMARLASLFSSRAVVKTAADDSKKPLPNSPPNSDTSSGYVGWPGTQNKQGATVAIESSYEDSDPGPSKTPEDTAWNRPSLENYSTPQNNDRPTSAEFHLTAALVDAAAAAKSPIAAEKQHRMSNHPMHGQVRSLHDIYGRDVDGDRAFHAISPMTDPWAMNTSDDTISDISTSFSKTSSAYFNPQEVRALNRGKIDHLHAVARNRNVAAAVMRFKPGEPQPPTEEALAINNQLTPPHRTFNATNAVGYRGFIDKTKDVPNLMDDTESDSSASRATSLHSSISAAKLRQGRQARLSKKDDHEDQILEEASSDIFDGLHNQRGADAESDVFDGLSNTGSMYYPRKGATPRESDEPENNDSFPSNSPHLVLLGGGLTTIQTSLQDFSNRKTASDFDENLTNSDYDQYGFVKIPGFNEMASRGMNTHDRSLSPSSEVMFAEPSPRAKQAIERYRQRPQENSGSESGSSLFSDPYSVDSYANSSGGLNQYYVHPDKMKILVKFFRKMSRKLAPKLGYEDLEIEEDATKAFALSEMRSRIMEKDIERGLERRGGTTTVDDIVLTSYNKAALRVRDAVVVSKAWRDGARPMDVVNAAFLTRRSLRSYFIPRLSYTGHTRKLTWEEVLWIDDLELSQYRCHSIGPRHLRGSEMFTIGDCQSILLKLCHDRCEDLRAALNEATARQIEAEEIMKEEGDSGDGMMTEAEMTYLTAMEDVKTYSRKLVIAERSFNLVKERIQKLVAKYESLLVKFDNDAESIAPSSVITYESSYYSDAYSRASEEGREREELIRRAQRAEVRAELAAREARLAKHETRASRSKNEAELQALQQRLDELQSESSAAVTEREHSVVLARAITANNRNVPRENSGNNPKRNRIDDVKKRFRDRSAAKKQNAKQGASNYGDGHGQSAGNNRQLKTPAQRERDNMYRQVGEEMFQHLDFYERSLKAVETDHN